MKIILGVVATIACFVLADSLTCNKCSFGISGLCFIPDTVQCSTNTSVCFGSKAVFSAVSSFAGFSTRGCVEGSTCNVTTPTTSNGTLPLIGMDYTVTTTCCNNADKCNNGASATKMTLSVALSAAAMAALWGSFM